MKAVHVTHENKFEVVDIKDNGDACLTDLRRLVGGNIEHMTPRCFPSGFAMYVDEDGHQNSHASEAAGKGSLINVFATNAYSGSVPVCGNVVIVREGFGDDGVEIQGMTESDCDHWMWWVRTWLERVS